MCPVPQLRAACHQPPRPSCCRAVQRRDPGAWPPPLSTARLGSHIHPPRREQEEAGGGPHRPLGRQEARPAKYQERCPRRRLESRSHQGRGSWEVPGAGGHQRVAGRACRCQCLQLARPARRRRPGDQDPRPGGGCLAGALAPLLPRQLGQRSSRLLAQWFQRPVRQRACPDREGFVHPEPSRLNPPALGRRGLWHPCRRPRQGILRGRASEGRPERPERVHRAG